MKLILGSSSSSRRRVLEEAGCVFEIMKPDIDEKAIRLDDPEELVLAIARAKSDALLARVNEPALIVTADQVVAHNGTILEKPHDAEEARAFLRSYRHSTVHVVNAMVVANAETGARGEGTDIATVVFKDLPDEFIEAQITRGDILRCAGALMVEDAAFQPYTEHVEGPSDSWLGLPLVLLTRLIEEVQNT